ncbi:MAG: extracellular solute-binding protein [Spirochaetaceae bacterium]|nr:extracellular solute-binding protein [Spirochaetaceae bacterium]
MVKRALKAVLFIGLAVLFVSCGNKKNLTEEEKALFKEYKSVKLAKDPETKKVYDFDGMQIIIGDFWSPSDGADNAEAVSPADEDAKRFHKFLKSAYNMDIDSYGIGSWGAHPQTVANFCTTGGDENYIFVIDARSVSIGLKGNLFYDLSTIKSIDWNDPKWDKATKEMTSKNGGFYGMRALASEPRGGVFFNKRLLKEAGIDPEEIYDLQKENKWTWETFEDMLKKTTRDLDNDGVFDTYGMANLSTEFCYLAAMSNGGSYIGKDSNGKYFNNIGNEKTLEALSWAADMKRKYERPQPEGANWDWMYASFINGEVAFQVDQEYRVGNIAEMQDDWGFVCFPLGPKGDGKYGTLAQDNVYVIPGCYDKERAEKIAKAFDLYTTEVPGYDATTWKEDYYSRFRDARAVDETLQLMRDNPVPRYDTMIIGINQVGSVIWNVYGGGQTAQEAYEATKNEYQGLIDEMNK